MLDADAPTAAPVHTFQDTNPQRGNGWVEAKPLDNPVPAGSYAEWGEVEFTQRYRKPSGAAHEYDPMRGLRRDDE
jgi:hypothetical protein